MASNTTSKEDLHAEDMLENRLSPTECLCYIHKLICKLKFIYKKQNRSRFAQPYSLHLQCRNFICHAFFILHELI